MIKIDTKGLMVEIERELTHKEFLAVHCGEYGAKVIPAKEYLVQQGYIQNSYRERGRQTGYGTGRFRVKAFAVIIPDYDILDDGGSSCRATH